MNSRGQAAVGDGPSLGDIGRTFWRLGWLGVGGPAAQIAMMQSEVVESRRWVSHERFAAALQLCMLLPGPEAQQLATWIGWQLGGLRGALLAGWGFVLPGALCMAGLCAVYLQGRDIHLVSAAFLGVRAAVLAVVLAAVIRLARRFWTRPIHVLFGVFTAAFVPRLLPFPVVVAVAAGLGTFLGAGRAVHNVGHSPGATGAALEADAGVTGGVPSIGRSVRTALLWTGIWWAPLLVLSWGPLRAPGLAELFVFFSKAATISFGGAYAALAWISQEAVVQQQWLRAELVADGLAFAEATPGPLVIVVQFLAFFAGYEWPGSTSPLWSAIAASVLSLWATFVPSFLWILTFGPWIDHLRSKPRLQGALAGVSACVVGAVIGLGIVLARSSLWPSGSFATPSWPALFILACTGAVTVWTPVSLPLRLLGASVLGVLLFG